MVRECAYVRMCVCVYVCTMYMRIWVVPPPPAFGPQPRSHLDYDHHNHHRQEMMRGHRFTQAYCLVSVRRLSSSPSRCWAHSRTTSVGNPFCCSAPRRQCVSLTTHSRTVPRCCDATAYNADIRSPTHPPTYLPTYPPTHLPTHLTQWDGYSLAACRVSRLSSLRSCSVAVRTRSLRSHSPSSRTSRRIASLSVGRRAPASPTHRNR